MKRRLTLKDLKDIESIYREIDFALARLNEYPEAFRLPYRKDLRKAQEFLCRRINTELTRK